jgi:hypothetical protein
VVLLLIDDQSNEPAKVNLGNLDNQLEILGCLILVTLLVAIFIHECHQVLLVNEAFARSINPLEQLQWTELLKQSLLHIESKIQKVLLHSHDSLLIVYQLGNVLAQ